MFWQLVNNAFVAMTYIPFTAQLHLHQGASLQSVLCCVLPSNSISKGLSALLQGYSVVVAEGGESVGHFHFRSFQLARDATWRLYIH